MSSYDSAGNLLVNVAVGGGGGGGGSVNIADPTTATQKLKVNADGSINVNPSSSSASTAIQDGTTTSQKLAVDASGKIGINNLPAEQSINLNQVNGTALSPTNPVPVVEEIGGSAISNANPMPVSQQGNVNVGNFPATQPVSGNVSITSLPSLPANQSVNIAQIGGVATQMATANAVAYANVPEHALGLDNGASLDKLVGLNGFASIEQMIAYFIRKGQGFSTTTGIVTSGATAGFNGLSVFNPSGSGKTIVLYSLKSFSATATQEQNNLTTADPAYGTTLAALNNKPGAGISSVASVSTSASVITQTGTVQDVGTSGSNNLYELFTVPGRVLVLAPSNGMSHAVYVAATTKYGVTVYWIEM